MMRTTKPLSAALLAVLLLSFTAITAEARSWRINSDATKKPHFTDINAAMSSSDVVAGDTLYLDPGTTISTSQTVSKQVTIIGCGYFLDGSMPAQATISNTVYLNTNGIKLEGLEVTGITYPNGGSYITIERCKLYRVEFNKSSQYLTLRQCYVGSVHGSSSTDSKTIGTLIENCIITGEGASTPNTLFYLYQTTIRNCYVKRNNGDAVISTVSDCNIYNNVLLHVGKKNQVVSVANSKVYNNVMSCAEGTYTAFPANVCLNNDSEAAIFAFEGTNDLRYRLKEDSPAKGYATDGGDCGPFGGMYPYVPSGLPLGMPYFESSTVPTRPQDGQLRVTQKVVIQGE